MSGYPTIKVTVRGRALRYAPFNLYRLREWNEAPVPLWMSVFGRWRAARVRSADEKEHAQ